MLCIICPTQRGDPLWICPSGPPGQHASRPSRQQEQQHSAQHLDLRAPLHSCLSRIEGAFRGSGQLQHFLSKLFPHSLWVCLSAFICEACLQPAEATRMAKQLIIKPAFAVLVLENAPAAKHQGEYNTLHQEIIQVPKVNIGLHLVR